jgi:hypothetical protein
MEYYSKSYLSIVYLLQPRTTLDYIRGQKEAKMQTAYIGIAIVSIAIIFGIIFLRAKQKPSESRRPSTLALIGMLLVVFAIVAGENRWLGYSFIGLGVLLAVVDLIRNPK